MKSSFAWAFALACVAISLAFGLAGSPAHAADALPAPGKAKYVVLVSVDGLAASYLDDPKAELPTLRMLAKQGASAKGMLAAFPTVTWPTHTTLVTGVYPARHGVIGNSVWHREKKRGLVYIGDPELTKDQAVRVPTLYDAAAAKGLTAAGVIWPCTNGAKSLKWMIPDAGKPELHAQFTTPGMIAELGAAGIDISKLGQWGWDKQYSNERDVLYTRVTQYLLEKHQVNLVMVHLITPDGVEHAYGPHTREAYQAVADSDMRIKEIWATLQKPPFAGNATLVVVSDHGFAPYQKLIKPNAVLKEMGLVTADEKNKVTERKAWCVVQGGAAFVYALDVENRAEQAAKIKEKLASLEGITGVLLPSDYPKFGLPDPAKNPQSPDFVLLTGPGYSFNDAVTLPVIADAGGHKGTHGHDFQPAYMHATFVAAGAGIKPGAKLDTMRGVDVAPTVARLMGLELKDVDGRVLSEILAP